MSCLVLLMSFTEIGPVAGWSVPFAPSRVRSAPAPGSSLIVSEVLEEVALYRGAAEAVQAILDVCRVARLRHLAVVDDAPRPLRAAFANDLVHRALDASREGPPRPRARHPPWRSSCGSGRLASASCRYVWSRCGLPRSPSPADASRRCPPVLRYSVRHVDRDCPHRSKEGVSMSTTDRLPSRLHHDAYATKDQEATLTFYEDLIGLPLMATWSEADELFGAERVYCHTFFGLGDGSALAFFQFAHQEDQDLFDPERRRHRYRHIALKVTPELQEEIHERLGAAGWSPRAPTCWSTDTAGRSTPRTRRPPARVHRRCAQRRRDRRRAPSRRPRHAEALARRDPPRQRLQVVGWLTGAPRTRHAERRWTSELRPEKRIGHGRSAARPPRVMSAAVGARAAGGGPRGRRPTPAACTVTLIAATVAPAGHGPARRSSGCRVTTARPTAPSPAGARPPGRASAGVGSVRCADNPDCDGVSSTSVSAVSPSSAMRTWPIEVATAG